MRLAFYSSALDYGDESLHGRSSYEPPTTGGRRLLTTPAANISVYVDTGDKADIDGGPLRDDYYARPRLAPPSVYFHNSFPQGGAAYCPQCTFVNKNPGLLCSLAEMGEAECLRRCATSRACMNRLCSVGERP